MQRRELPATSSAIRSHDDLIDAAFHALSVSFKFEVNAPAADLRLKLRDRDLEEPVQRSKPIKLKSDALARLAAANDGKASSDTSSSSSSNSSSDSTSSASDDAAKRKPRSGNSTNRSRRNSRDTSADDGPYVLVSRTASPVLSTRLLCSTQASTGGFTSAQPS